MEVAMVYRVVEFSTGNLGRHALAGIDARPDLELVGLWVSNPEKVGRDAGELAGLGRSLGVAATDDVDTLLALRPDCIVYTAMADDRPMEAIKVLEQLLRAGVNVATSGPAFLTFPSGDFLDVVAPLRAAAEEGGVSLWTSGIDPGFANDSLPLLLTGISERIDEVRCTEILSYAEYDQPMMLFDLMGFSKPLDHEPRPMMLQPGILSMAFGSVVSQIAAALGVELDSVEEFYEQLPAPETFEIAAGTIPAGTAAGVRFEIRGIVGGRAVIVAEHVTRLRADIGPDWPQPIGDGSYRVRISGEPDMTLDLRLVAADGTVNTAVFKATAMRLVNAVPAVVEAPPGLLTAMDLPLTTGRGLLR
jgi:4-hydroxy-tetrahydrodipicolinate reductase